MLRVRFAQHITHGRRLLRHLALRRTALRQVYTTTPIPFLHRVGFVDAPAWLADRTRLPVAHDSFEPLTEQFAEPAAERLDSGPDGVRESQIEATLPEENPVDTTAATELIVQTGVAQSGVPQQDLRAKPAEVRKLQAASPIGEPPVPSGSESKTIFMPNETSSKAPQPQAFKRTVLGKPAKTNSALHEPKSPVDVPAASVHPDATPQSEGLEETPVASATSLLAEAGVNALNIEQTASLSPPSSPETVITVPTQAAASQAGQTVEGSSSSLPPKSESSAEESRVAAGEPAPSRVESSTAAAAPNFPLRRRAQIQEVAQTNSENTPTAQKAAPPTKQIQKAGNLPRPLLPDPALEPESTEAQEMFTPRADVDRSPAAWREKLAEAMRVEAEHAKRQTADEPNTDNVAAHPRRGASKPSASLSQQTVTTPALRRISPQPQHLSPSARRFLTPRVGFDVRDVEVHQGPAVSRLLAASGADAIAAEDSILLGPGHETESPKALALLAHELTHIARGREARFVPPVLRSTAGRSGARSAEVIHNSADGENVALRVESEVKQEGLENAETEHNVSPRRLETSTAQIANQESSTTLPTSSESRPRAASAFSAAERSWGGLPAPWDPLPDLFSSPETSQPTHAVAADSGASMSAAPAAAPSASSSEAVTPAMAESSRSLPQTESPHAASAHPEEGKQVTPDLDALARQVYSVMRRRLTAEHRREFM